MMYIDQAGLCGICKRPDSSGIKLSVDHCHQTGKVRGLLCGNCNRALGLFRDNINLLTNAVSYLTKIYGD